MDEPFLDAVMGAMTRLPVIVEGVAWEQILSVAALFAILRLAAGRRVGLRYIVGASLLGSFALWPNVLVLWTELAERNTHPSFFAIPDAASPGLYLFQILMSDILLVVLLNQYALLAGLLVIPASLLAGASSARGRQAGYGLFLAVLPASWVLALFSRVPW